MALLAGWGPIALPGPNDVWWGYIVGPMVGGPVGATVYDLLIRGVPAGQEQSIIYEEASDLQRKEQ